MSGKDCLITGISHINVRVKDVKRAVSFYTNRLGFKLIVNDPVIERYEVASQDSSGPGISFVEDKKAVGENTGITFSTRDIHGTCQMLRKNGVRVTEPYQAHGEWWAGFKDVDGNSYGVRQV